MADQDKPTSRYELKGRTAIEATHPHSPPVAWCKKCQAVRAAS